MKTPVRIRIIVILLAVLLPGAGLAGWLYVEQSLEKNFHTFIQAQSKLDIEYSEMKINPLKRNITLVQPRITYSGDIEIKAGEIVFQDLLIADNIPVKMTIKATDMDIKKLYPSLELTREIELSGTRLSGINGVLKYDYQPEGYLLKIPQFTLESNDLGLFCSGLILSNLNIEYISSIQNPFLLAAALLGIRIDYFQAGYEDYGMIKKLAEFKGWQRSLDNDPGEILDELFKDRDNPVDNFLRGEKPLSIRLAPQKPVPVSAILSSSSIASASRLLNLEISNRKPELCNEPYTQ